VGNYITYQGNLQDGGGPANGPYDFQFGIFDAESGGNQIGPTISLADVPVVNGNFSVTLDFGPNAFAGDARWIDTAVRPGAETGAYIYLSPRRGITPVPYALHSNSTSEIIHDFTVAPGETVGPGDVVSLFGIGDNRIVKGYGARGFGPVATLPTFSTNRVVQSVVSLSPSAFAISVSFFTGADQLLVGTVAGDTITPGSWTPIPGAFGSSVAALSASKIAIVYTAGANGYGTAQIADVSGTSITFGSFYVFDPTNYSGGICTALSPTRFVVAGYHNAALVADVNGDEITFGPSVPYGPGSPLSIATLSPTQFVLRYRPTGSQSDGIFVGTVSGSTITFGPPASLQQVDEATVIALSSNQFVTISENLFATSPNQGQHVGDLFVVGSVAGDSSVTFGPPFNPILGGGAAMAALSPSQFVSLTDDSNEPNADGLIMNVSGNSISVASQFIPPVSTSETTVRVSALSPNQIVIANAVDAVFGTTPISQPLPIGIAKAPGAAGERVPVLLRGPISNVQSGLTIGRTYFSDPNGHLQLDPQPLAVGLAISPNEIMLGGGLPIAALPAQ